MKIITGYTGTAHVTAAQDGALNMGLVGGNAILNVGSKMVPTIQSNNEVRVPDGVLIFQGRAAIIEAGSYDALTITSGTQGKNRKDMIVAKYEMNGSGVESITLVVKEGTPVSGTPAAPSYTSGDLYNGDTVAELPLWYVNISGTTISSVSSVTSADETDYAVRANNHASMVQQITDYSTMSTNITDLTNALNGIKIYKQSITSGGGCYVNVSNSTQLLIITHGAGTTKGMWLANFTSGGVGTKAVIYQADTADIAFLTRQVEVTATANCTLYVACLAGSVTSITNL